MMFKFDERTSLFACLSTVAVGLVTRARIGVTRVHHSASDLLFANHRSRRPAWPRPIVGCDYGYRSGMLPSSLRPTPIF